MRHSTDAPREFAERHQTLDGIENMLQNRRPPLLIFSEVSEDIYVLPAGYGHPTRRTIVAPRSMQGQLERSIGPTDDLDAYEPFRQEPTAAERAIGDFRASVRRAEVRLMAVGAALGSGIIVAAVLLPR